MYVKLLECSTSFQLSYYMLQRLLDLYKPPGARWGGEMAESTKVLALLLEVGLLQVRILEAAKGVKTFGT